MRNRFAFVAAGAVAFALAGAAHAEMFSGGPVYGGPSSVGGTVTCRIFNYGLAPVTLTARQIFTNTGVSVSLASDTCGTTLASAKYCAFSAPISGNLAYSCRIVAIGQDERVSGMAEIQNSSAAVLNSVAISK